MNDIGTMDPDAREALNKLMEEWDVREHHSHNKKGSHFDLRFRDEDGKLKYWRTRASWVAEFNGVETHDKEGKCLRVVRHLTNQGTDDRWKFLKVVAKGACMQKISECMHQSRGEKNGMAKMTLAKVFVLRNQASACKQKPNSAWYEEQGRVHGCTGRNIQYIIDHKTWKV